MTRFEVDTELLRKAAAELGEAETTFRSAAVCSPLELDDEAFGPSAIGREAADLLLRRAKQMPEALEDLAVGAGALADTLVVAAAAFEATEWAAGPR